MTIFKEIESEEYLTISETKDLLAEVEAERAADEDREMRYELARAIEHVNRFAVLDAAEAQELVAELEAHEKIDSEVAHRIADLLPQDRDEMRSVFAQERYSLSGEELDELLDIVAKYA
ncbi:MAG: RNA polymerase Rpb4 family protein [Natronomonas sp.]